MSGGGDDGRSGDGGGVEGDVGVGDDESSGL